MKTISFEVFSNSPHYQEEILLFSFLEKHLFAAGLQRERITREQRRLNKLIREYQTHSIPRIMRSLFVDIHFFLIAVTNIERVLEKLRKIRSYDGDFVQICKKYRKQIAVIDSFRDHLEHIVEGGLKGVDKKGKKLKAPGDLGNLVNNSFTFGGESFDLRDAFRLVEALGTDLKRWNEKLVNQYRSQR